MSSFFLSDGRPLYLTKEDYLDLVVERKGCFICGRSNEDFDFNNEHVIPDWILRDLKIHHRSISKSDERLKYYSTHKIPCCERCNSLLGEKVEKPISELLRKTPEDFSRLINEKSNFELLYCWLANIAYKSVHSDLYTKVDNPKFEINNLGELHNWSNMHHLNVLCRIFFTETDIDTNAFGTVRIFFFPDENDEFSPEGFDFVTFFEASAVFLRFRRIGLIAVFNDGGACGGIFDDNFIVPPGGLKEPIRSIDCREVLAEMATINLFLKERPSYRSETDPISIKSITKVSFPESRPEVEYDPSNPEDRFVRNQLFQSAFSHIKPHLPLEKQRLLEDGRLSFLKEIGYVRSS
ncbi:hypothetical protein [Ruegeria sp. HKCCA4633]|uniref:hypothetical protein n=1 Tax=Ruegeria sp. HKCCA4633 TaxID=2682983 RepID=UPI00148977BF|nr:hypothetical protein [Ruegeria sp. HKCCA4633]